MAYKINDKFATKTYCEVPQKNPMRWVVLKRDSETEFHTQTGKIKCKDFFNDTLAFWKEGQKFGIYGYQNDLEKDKEGVFFLLKFVENKDKFFEGLSVINAKLKEQLGVVISAYDQGKDEVIILTPHELWDSTWRLSLITMLIRCCNYGYTYKTWEDFFHSQAPLTIEGVFDQRTIKNTRTWGFVVPKQYSKLWYFAGPQYNSEKAPKQTGSTIHNNGCVNWSQFMSMEGVQAA